MTKTQEIFNKYAKFVVTHGETPVLLFEDMNKIIGEILIHDDEIKDDSSARLISRQQLDKLKEKIADNYCNIPDVCGSKWEFANKLHARTNAQIRMYNELLDKLVFD